ncbi:hypothetical protein JX266_004363 [Neoarthrinium moseri]|nr:hypothetical protein JX266_004363 [Neoarthrinium moseri]
MTIESDLPSRYEIRTLGPEHAEWAKAIVSHSNLFASPVWSQIYRQDATQRCYDLFRTADYLVDHQIDSGLSLGIFDKEYKFKQPASAATGGKLYWKLDDASAGGEELLEQMDFPLVSVALAYDSINALDLEKLTPMIAVLPPLLIAFKLLEERDEREPSSWKATGPAQVLFRNATATKVGEEGHGFMKLLARYMMRKSAAEGWRGIQIECAHDAVTHVWSKPPSPFKGEAVSRFNCDTYEHKDEEGRTTFPFQPATQELVKVYVHLTPS